MTTDDLYDAFIVQQQRFLAVANEHQPRDRRWESSQSYDWWSYPVRTVHSGGVYIQVMADLELREAAVELLIAAKTYLLACSTSVSNAMLWKLGQNVKEEYGLA